LIAIEEKKKASSRIDHPIIITNVTVLSFYLSKRSNERTNERTSNYPSTSRNEQNE
jgi:hypothetical protein